MPRFSNCTRYLNKCRWWWCCRPERYVGSWIRCGISFEVDVDQMKPAHSPNHKPFAERRSSVCNVWTLCTWPEQKKMIKWARTDYLLDKVFRRFMHRLKICIFFKQKVAISNRLIVIRPIDGGINNKNKSTNWWWLRFQVRSSSQTKHKQY